MVLYHISFPKQFLRFPRVNKFCSVVFYVAFMNPFPDSKDSSLAYR